MSDADALVGLPPGGPTTVADVKAQLAIATDDTRDDTRLGAIVDAVNSMVRTWRVSVAAVDDDQVLDVVVDPAWPYRVVYGSTLLAARYYRRKNSPAGVEAMGAAGAVYVMRTDPDVAQLLQLGTHSPPTVG
jgi:hypothetical protein